MEIAELVAHMQEQAAGNESFQRQDLVKFPDILALVKHIAPHPQVNRKDRHSEFALHEDLLCLSYHMRYGKISRKEKKQKGERR